jgi:hypothetical protein
MAEIVHRFACATDNDGFPECMGDGSTCGPDDICLGLEQPEQVKAAPTCLCQRLRPIACYGTITAEDLLCDDCRDGCNMAFRSFSGGGGFHMRTEIRFG